MYFMQSECFASFVYNDWVGQDNSVYKSDLLPTQDVLEYITCATSRS